MPAGRNPKPAALRALEGNPGKRPLRREPDMGKPAPSDARPPTFLSETARREWARIYPILLASRVLTLGDLQTLAIYCALYARWREAETQLAELKGEWFVTGVGGSKQAHPWITISNRAAELMRAYLSELGMTPAARARMGVEDGPRPGRGKRPKAPEVGGRFAGLIGPG